MAGATPALGGDDINRRRLFESLPVRAHGGLVCEFGWHALTIGKGVWIVSSTDFHALPDGQGVPPTTATIHQIELLARRG